MRPIMLRHPRFTGTLATLAIILPGLTPLALAQAPSLAYVQPLPPQAVQDVQQHLAQAGFYRGRIDGVWGADSEAALQQFQSSHQLQVTGQLNEATARNLGLSPEALVAAAQPAPPSTPAALSPDTVRSIQGRLRHLGFYDGAIDGVWGSGTQAAYSNYQARNGLQVTGQPNAPTLQSLGLTPVGR